MVKVKYLKCEVSEGDFSVNKRVEFPDTNGRIISGFFHKDIIKENRLEIQVVESGKDKSLIRAPHEGYFFEGTAIYVNNNLLSNLSDSKPL